MEGYIETFKAEKVDTYYARATLNIDSSSVNVIKSTKNINIKYLTMSLSQYFYTYNVGVDRTNS